MVGAGRVAADAEAAHHLGAAAIQRDPAAKGDDAAGIVTDAIAAYKPIELSVVTLLKNGLNGFALFRP